MGVLPTDLEASVGTYEFRSYGGERYDRQVGGTLFLALILAIFNFYIGVEWPISFCPGLTEKLPEK